MSLNQFVNTNFYEIIFYIIIYSFLGWCCEVLYAFKNQKKFVNRGFLHGPLCPIYGACIVSLVLLLDSFNENIFILFLISFISTSIIEYSTGLLLEKVFKKKYWDYSMDPLNLHGRICFHFSLMWGGVSLAVVKIIHPIVSYLVSSIPTTIGLIFIYIIVCSLIIDFITTLRNLIDFKKLVHPFQFDNSILIDKYNSIFQLSRTKSLNNLLEDKLINLLNKITKRNLK